VFDENEIEVFSAEPFFVVTTIAPFAALDP
jgi:hypothetical protein